MSYMPGAAIRRGRLPELKRLVKLALCITYFPISSVGLAVARFAGRGRPRLVILYYHAVRTSHRDRFARQLEMVRAGAESVVMPDFRVASAPANLFVAITFDDAFVSVIENALPELAARGMPATIFVPSGMLGRAPGWEMEDAPEDMTETVASPEVLRAVCQGPVMMGSHSVTHPRLPGLDRDAAMVEIAESKARLGTILSRDIDMFAFPYGEYDDDTVKLCRSAGYRLAFTTVPWVCDPTEDGFLRGRVPVSPDDWQLEFWLKMRGAYACLPPFWRLKRWLVRLFSCAIPVASRASQGSAANSKRSGAVATSP